MTLLSKHEKRDSGRLPIFSKSLGIPYFKPISVLFYLFRDSRHTVSTWNETMAWMSAVHGNKSYPGVWGNKSALYLGRQPGSPYQPHLQGFIATTILIQWNGCTPFCTPLNTGDAPLHPVIGLDYSSFYEGLQSSLFAHEKRDINAPRSISLSSYYYNSLVKHRPNNLNSIIWYPLWFVYRVTHS